jgi:hypothetical protein
MKGTSVLISGTCRGRVDATYVYKNKVITSVTMTEEALQIIFKDGTGLRIYDDGQSCCESRYMSTDDIQDLVGSVIQTIEVKDGSTTDTGYDEVHDQEFLEIQTNKGFFIFANHNVHNGYYGGFDLVVEEIS